MKWTQKSLLTALFYLLAGIERQMKPSRFAGSGGPVAQALSIMSWNINGLRSFIKHDKDGTMLTNLLKRRNVDVLCLQETKLQEMHVPSMEEHLKAVYGAKRIYWNCSRARKGYSGTATVMFNDLNQNGSNMEELVEYGIGEEEGDMEGRSITVTCPGAYTLVNAYVPNSGSVLNRLGYRTQKWDTQMCKYMTSLQHKAKEMDHDLVMLAGDLNVARTGIDYYNPKEPRTKKQPGTTPEEQISFDQQLLAKCGSGGMIDTYRAKHPDIRRYSFFNARLGARGRETRMGMRIDYVLMMKTDHSKNENSAHKCEYDAYIEEELSHPYSDHCPVGIVFQQI